MPDRRSHQSSFPNPGELPPIEDDQTYEAIKGLLGTFDEALPMLSTPDVKRGMQRWANAMRRGIEEYDRERGA
jgi:hypothetical protein